ncbi:MAG: hypothetical protein ACYC0N_03185, partial [Carboxydocellales bacterium]
MAKRVLILSTILLLIILQTQPVWASTLAKKVEVELTPNDTDINASNIRIKWEYASGDVLEKSVDGQSWQGVSPIKDGEAMVSAVPNWSIMYFRIRDSLNNLTPFTTFPPNQNAHDI